MPSEMVATTMIGASAFGRTWRMRAPNFETPSERAAVTKSALRTSITAPRVMRAICGQPKTTRDDTRSRRVLFARNIGSCIITIAPRISGRAKKMSLMRARTASTQPP